MTIQEIKFHQVYMSSQILTTFPHQMVNVKTGIQCYRNVDDYVLSRSVSSPVFLDCPSVLLNLQDVNWFSLALKSENFLDFSY